MHSDSLIGVLAIFTIGAAFLGAAFFFLRHNFDPKNREITKSVIRDESSAHTGVRGGQKPDHL